ncbi:hypothetical protein SKAU_G00417010 [Synaphobranchus kaupii]|uniref:Heat shock protein 70 n=1 Tax=Synaphobranchus kaupii TaxID=118154 RepID=A0A9Q1IA10_SYNKA|nr:hypothetical protein SKAU_G00417010 [Synaphobranchus kaupii]
MDHCQAGLFLEDLTTLEESILLCQLPRNSPGSETPFTLGNTRRVQDIPDQVFQTQDSPRVPLSRDDLFLLPTTQEQREHGKVEIIANDQGNRTTPSYVAFTDSERLIGDAAKNQVAMNPANTVFGVSKNQHTLQAFQDHDWESLSYGLTDRCCITSPLTSLYTISSAPLPPPSRCQTS